MRLSLGLILLAACSPVVAHVPDATSIDGTPDAPSHGMVTVKVYDLNGSAAVVVGVPVLFVEADGTQVGHPVTDATGVASADVHANASATVVIVSGTSTNIETLYGIQPGDNIILGPTNPAATSVGNFSVSFPVYMGATNYDVFGPCGSSTTTTSPATLTMYSDCKLDSMDITVVPKDASGNGLGYITKTAVPFVASGTTAVSGAYTVMSGFTATLTNLDPAITNVSLDRNVPDNYGFSKSVSGTPTNGTLTLMAPGPVGAQALISTSLGKAMSSQLVLQGIAGNVQTYGFDAKATLLPWTNVPALDIANHKVMISTDNTGTTSDAPDAVFSQVSYSRTMGATTTNFSWLLVGPTPTDMVLPNIPIDIGDVMPKMTDTMGFLLAAQIEADTVNGFGDIRLDLYKNINAVTDPPHRTMMTKVRESLASASGH